MRLPNLAHGMSKTWKNWGMETASTTAVFLFFALLLVTPNTYNIGPIFLLATGVYWLARGRLTPLPSRSTILIVPFAAYFLAIATTTALSGWDMRLIDTPSRLILLIPVLWVLTQTGFRIQAIWHGAAIGAIGAFFMALYQRYASGLDRAEGFQHPIQFGDIGMLLGLLSLVAVLRFASTRQSMLAAFSMLGALAGIMASLLSGSRGGWIGLPLIIMTLLGYYANTLGRRRILAISGLLALMLYIAFISPQTGVKDRLNAAINDITHYQHENGANSSVGARLELYKAGAMLIDDAGMFGLGEQGARDKLQAMANDGLIRPAIVDMGHFHNELLDHLIRNGFVGAIALIMLYAVPLIGFITHAGSHDPDIKAAAVAGIITVTSVIDFGLSQKFFAHQIGLMTYGFTLVVLWAATTHPRHRSIH
ncbi:MAG: O-antigen ligase family protein [Halothiobacillaceae bacterium]|nr:MAG: O-antigen ligase family protein [Halothiobacillaceae bacterium]